MTRRGSEESTPGRHVAPFVGSVAELARLLVCHRRLGAALARSAGVSRFQLEAVECVAALLGTDRVLLCRLDEREPGFLRVAATTGPLGRLEGALLPASESFEGSVLGREGVVVAAGSPERGMFFRTREHERSIGPAIAVRLGRARGDGDGPLGVILAARAPEGEPFAVSEGRLLEEVAAPLSDAIRVAEQLAAGRGDRTAVDYWREARSQRTWLETHREIAVQREEAVFRISADGPIDWESPTTSLLGAGRPPPATTRDLLARLTVDGRAAVEAGLLRIATQAPPAMLSVNCGFETWPGSERPVLVRIWKLRAGERLFGVLSASGGVEADPASPGRREPAAPRGDTHPVPESHPLEHGPDVTDAEPANLATAWPPSSTPLVWSETGYGGAGRVALEAWLAAFAGSGDEPVDEAPAPIVPDPEPYHEPPLHVQPPADFQVVFAEDSLEVVDRFDPPTDSVSAIDTSAADDAADLVSIPDRYAAADSVSDGSIGDDSVSDDSVSDDSVSDDSIGDGSIGDVSVSDEFSADASADEGPAAIDSTAVDSVDSEAASSTTADSGPADSAETDTGPANSEDARSPETGVLAFVRPATTLAALAGAPAADPAARESSRGTALSDVHATVLDDLTDLHCHLVPGIEDGTTDDAEAVAALERIYDAGVRRLVVTPHLRMSTARIGEPAEIGRALERVTGLAAEHFPDLRILRGAEVMLDETEPATLRAPWMRLASTRFVLVEFVRLWAPTRSAEMLRAITEAGYVPVVAHPERYQNASERQLMGWREAGARLQVNCGSLLGHHGPGARDRAWALLTTGAVDCLASNYRGRGAYPITAVVELLESVDAVAQAEALLRTNPSRIVHGEDPLEVAPLGGSKSLIRRISRAVGFR